MPDTYTLYKLIILYTLNEAGFPITNAQMTEFVLNKGYTTYFVLQEVIGELIDAELILPMIRIVFLKSTVRPCESVMRPSSSTCSSTLNTSGCAFSISSKRTTLYGRRLTASVS